jgi:hypothetical protein
MVKRKDQKYNGQKKRPKIQWSKEKTKKTMVKRKDQKDNGQKKRPKIQWSKEKTKNTMVKRKDQKYNGRQTTKHRATRHPLVKSIEGLAIPDSRVTLAMLLLTTRTPSDMEIELGHQYT